MASSKGTRALLLPCLSQWQSTGRGPSASMEQKARRMDEKRLVRACNCLNAFSGHFSFQSSSAVSMVRIL